MVEVEAGGASIAGQLFDVPDELWARIFAAEPPGLHFTEVELDDGQVVATMFGEPGSAETEGMEITAHGGWAAYVATLD